jgi:hypothetical protein
MLDMTVYGRQEPWEDSPEGWPRRGATKASAATGGQSRSGPASRLAAPTTSAPPGAERMAALEGAGATAREHREQQ